MSRLIRVGLLAARPVYYQAPLYRRVAGTSGIEFTAIFASTAGVRPMDGGYGQAVSWGAEVLEGYRSVFLNRAESNPEGGSTFALRDLDVVGLLGRSAFDVLWLHGYHTITHLLAAATQRARGGALLIREEQTLLHPRPPWKRAIKSVGLRLMTHEAYGLYIGSENRRWFEHFGIPQERLFFAPYTADNELLQRSAQDLSHRKPELKQSFGIAAESPLIVAVGRFIPKKQPLALLEAFRRLRATRRCALLLVGSGPLESQMREKVEQEGIPDVTFAGFLNQQEIRRAYAAADIFVLASMEHETWGLVVNEAMNFSLPIVVTDAVGSAIDLVRDGENGYVVSRCSIDELTAALSRLVDSPDRRMSFGRASLKRIQPWNYDLAADGVTAAIRRSVGGAGAR